MKESQANPNPSLILPILLFALTLQCHTQCTRQRCCLPSTCTALYCRQKSSETWISSESYDNYQFTKLVLVGSQCKPCAYNCKVCGSEVDCLQCYDGYYLNTTTNTCNPCDYKCLKCQPINTLLKCSQCDTSTYLDPTQATCKPCPPGSKSCSDQTTIIECQPGYLKSSNSLFCTPCTSNCLNCPSSTAVCTVCETGYYVSGGLCRKCGITGCDSCVAVGSVVYCNLCTAGFYRASSTSCLSCAANCKVCTNATVCTTCKTGYFIQAGGCSAVAIKTLNCDIYSNTTVNGTNKCSTCISGYYLTSSGLQCIPCSITCTSCYGNHFGRCTACTSTSKLFNQMCIPVPYITSTQLQLYYTATSNYNSFVGGALSCSNFLLSGTNLVMNLSNLASYKLVIKFKIFTDISGQTYNISLNSTSNTTSLNSSNTNFNSSTLTSSSVGYKICPQNPSTPYYAHISQISFTGIKTQNTLTFTSLSSASIYISQLLVTANKCSSLCLQCSQTRCFLCLTDNLYKQDAYCVYVCSTNSGYYTYEQTKECVKECPLGSYPQLTNTTCMACVEPCVTCLDRGYCLSCIQGYYLDVRTHLCGKECPYRYYGSVKTQKCQACVGRCNQCITDTQCVTCQVGFLSNTTCVDTCPPGYYQNLTTITCEKCSLICLECEYNSNNCITCPIGLLLYNNTCISTCPDGLYSSLSTGTCQSCIYPCERCVNGSTVCLSCVEGYLLGNVCYASCPIGYYQQNIQLLCLPCNSTCTKCLNSANTCLQCLSGYKLHLATCLSTCPEKFYPQVQSISIIICSNCVGICNTCLNQSYCLSCRANFLASNGSGVCVRATFCFVGEFGDITSLKCQPCSAQCYTCFYASTFCTSCKTGYTLYNNTCKSTCPSTYFYPIQTTTTTPNGTTPAPTLTFTHTTCKTCEQPCLTCLNQNLCLSCVQGYKYSNVANLCSSTCAIGSFFDVASNDCRDCSANCVDCVSGQFCNICRVETYIHGISSVQNQCVATCPDGLYADGASCMSCIYPCLLCSSSIDCVTCQNGILYQSRCLSGCPDSTFMNIINNTCQNCSGNCLTCKDQANRCISCNSGLYLYAENYTCLSTCPSKTYAFQITKSCVKCPETCQTCSNSSYCLTCISGKTFLNLQNHMCVESCPVAYYGNSQTLICQICSPKCQTCLNKSWQCLTCATNYLLTRLQNATYDCVTTCPSRYYNDTSICYRCIFPCQECYSSSQCKTCAPGIYFYNQTNMCLLSCPLQTYFVTTPSLQCKKCIHPCKTCKNQSNCISCQNNFYLYKGSCLDKCPQKYYADGSKICNKCFGLCETCSGKYYCLTCLTGFAYSGFCYSACPPGTFASIQTKKCEPCSPQCLQCTGTAYYCKKCQSNFFAYRGVCQSDCPVGTFKNAQICQTCTFPCVKCTNQYTCDQCLGGYLLYMNINCINNIKKCPNDLYKLNFKQCVQSTMCPSTYYKDEQSKTCSTECIPQKYVHRESLMCLDQCFEGEYVGENMVCRSWLKYPPISLMGMETLTFIKSSYIHIVVIFNETEQWLQNSQYLYQITNTQIGQRRLLSPSHPTNYTLQSPTELILQLKQMPYSLQLSLPAHTVRSALTHYNLQTTTLSVRMPAFTAYTYSQVYIGSIMRQFSEGISWFIILFSLFFLVGNRVSEVYVLWDIGQLLYLVVFLGVQYPPNLNQFLVGLSNINFLFVPSLFKSIVPEKRLKSTSPFYAYSYDNSFLRTAGSPLLLVVIVLCIYIILKTIQIIMKKSQKVKQKMTQYPKLRTFIFKSLLRFRWHHTSDLFFLTYNIITLFSIAQIKNLPQNPHNIPSNVLCVILFLVYLAFPCFVSYKLYKHFGNIAKGKMVANLQCFYRGIEKSNRFGIAVIVIRYFRKLMYGVVIGVFSDEPMFALPILMFSSILFGLFIFINKPYKKKLSNVVTVWTESFLVITYLIIAIIQFGVDSFTINTKMILGWVCCGLLLIVLFALIFEVFCKTMFYLQPQTQKDKGITNLSAQDNQLIKKFSQQYIRQKAQQFFDHYFGKLKKNFNLDDSQSMLNNQHEYEQGDSQNSQNNEERQRNWGIDSESESRRSDQFRHYGEVSDEGTADKIQGGGKQNKKAPNYLIRCVKQLN